jgi:hypothetical protein
MFLNNAFGNFCVNSSVLKWYTGESMISSFFTKAIQRLLGARGYPRAQSVMVRR